jgi:hypothetical protein
MKLSIKKFAQTDTRWSGEKLGTSASTIGSHGCVISCLSSLFCYYGFDTDPARFNQLCKDKGVYVSRNLVDWPKIENIYEFIKFKERIDCVKTPAPTGRLDEELTEGRPVILNVDLNPNQPGPDHFIICIGKTEDNHYICYDPWYLNEDAIFFDARYGDPIKNIFGMRLINGPVPLPDTPQPSIADLKGQIVQYEKTMEDIKEHLRPAGIMPQDDLPKVIGAIDELINIRNEYDEHKKKDQAESEKPVEIVDKKEEFLGQFALLNLIIKLFVKRGDSNE